MSLSVPCCCNEACDYFSDNFNRANANPPGTNYTVLAGTVEINANRLKFTGNSKLLITKNSPNTDGRNGADLSIVSFNADTDRIRVDLDYVDANNSHGFDAPVKPDAAGPAKIYKRTAGVDTQLKSLSNGSWRTSSAGSGTYAASACMNKVHAVAAVNVGSFSPFIYAFTAPHGGRQVLISTTSAGSIELDNLVLRQVKQNSLDASHGGTPCIYCRLCTYCDATPEELDIVAANVEAEIVAAGGTHNAGNNGLFSAAFSLAFSGLSISGALSPNCSWLTASLPLNVSVTIGPTTYTHFSYGVTFDGTDFLASFNYLRVVAGTITHTLSPVVWVGLRSNFACEPGASISIAQNDRSGGGGPLGLASITVVYP